MSISRYSFPAALALAAGLALALQGAATMARAEGVAAPVAKGRITVSGEGHVSAAPDMATVTLGVTTEAKTAAAAMRANSTELGRVMAELEGAGIAARDIQTSGLSLNPRWQQSNQGDERQITGFIAANRVTVRVRQLDSLGGVLDALVKAGANTIDGLSFGLSDPAPLEDAARKAAVADAMARAKLLAEAAGVTLGPVLAINDSGVAQPMPLARMAVAMEAKAVPVAAGELTVDASVSMVFAIKQ